MNIAFSLDFAFFASYVEQIEFFQCEHVLLLYVVRTMYVRFTFISRIIFFDLLLLYINIFNNLYGAHSACSALQQDEGARCTCILLLEYSRRMAAQSRNESIFILLAHSITAMKYELFESAIELG